MREVNTSYLFVFFFALFFVNGSLLGQTKQELQKKKGAIQKEIQLVNKLLEENSKDKAITVEQLLKLNAKISSRRLLIRLIGQEVAIVNDEIKEGELKINQLTGQIDVLKQQYAKMIQMASRNRSDYRKLMYVFAADDFNKAYKRLTYFQQLAKYRQLQVEQINTSVAKLEGKLAVLKKKKAEKIRLLSSEKKERNKLNEEKSEQEKTAASLKSKEDKLKKELKAKELAAGKLQKAIARIIEEEIRKAKAKSKGKEGFPLTPEAQKLSNSFAANKGRLPWPVSEGVITARFGKYQHPVLKGIQVNNNGIDISAPTGSTARALFEGVVSSVAIIPGEGKVVMVRHGAYLSVYSYMSQVFVSKGDKITTKQQLGVLVNDSKKKKSGVHLEIWKGMTKLNPEYWIYRK